MLLKLLLGLALTTPFWGLGHPLWEVDDARYAEVPREMVETGDWLTPRLDYFDYVEKPPLIYWLPAVSYKLFGVNEAAARLPNALLALLGLLGVWWLGAWLFSPAVGAWAAILLSVCMEYFLLGRLLTPDMFLSVFLFWTTALILRVLRKPEDSGWAAPAAWVSMALAFLSKGLVSLLLPGSWIIALALFFPAARKNLRLLLRGGGPLLFLLIVGSWFWAMERRHPGFFNFFVVEQHFQRYLTPRYARTGPWYYFLGVDAGGSLPWTPLWLCASILPLLRWSKEDDRRKQLALWVFGVFAFFSISRSKLPTYILPIFAYQALLSAELLVRCEDDSAVDRSWRLAAGAMAFLLACALPFGLHLAPQKLPQLPSMLFPLAGAAVGLLAASLAGLGLRKPAAAALLACAAWGVVLAAADPMAPWLSARDISAELSSRLRPGDSVFAYDRYMHGVPFYTRRPVDKVVNWLGELHYAKRDPRFADRFGDDDTIRKIGKKERVFVVLPKKVLQHFRTLRPTDDPPRLTTVGDWVLAEL
ncbi:MAG: glycosyltransferase family 39 protein [Elusimicrobiota bacterium]|jgi:4-amino-4-deoxy-L-arabinose transferase-like glycosyltransferase